MRRDLALDAVRGLAIVSMVVGHLAGNSLAHRLLHFPRWVDAAFAFVFLSGLILGIVHRRVSDKRGAPSYEKVGRRAFLLYVVQFAMLVLALGVSSLAVAAGSLPHPEDFGGWVAALGLAATLQLPARDLTILPMYVVLLLIALLALYLLRAGKAWVVALGSVAVYAVSFVAPEWTVLPYLRDDPQDQFNWAAWQLPFTGALIIGWNWSARDLAARVTETRVVVASIGVFFACAVLARLTYAGLLPESLVVDRLFAKFDLGPGVILFGIAGLIVLYWIASRLSRRRTTSRLLDLTLVRIGQRSLDSFVILCLAVILVPAFLPYDRSGAAGMAVAATALVACWAWATFRRTRQPLAAGPDPVWDRAAR